jgi:hypothetical protein
MHSAILPGYIPIGIRQNHMGMTKFGALDDPGFVAVAAEIRRWARALGASADEYSRTRESAWNPSSPGAGAAPDSRVLRITQGGSQHTGTTTVNGGSLFQGNYVG